jgi:hypothetical protein
VAVKLQGKTGVASWKRALGVGLSHSSERACEGSEKAEAKGRAEQGTFWRER